VEGITVEECFDTQVAGNRAERRAAGKRSKKAAALGSGVILAASGAGMAATLAASSPAAAASQTFTVTNLDDSGAGSFRQAILDANANVGKDTITFQAGLSGTITLKSDLDWITDAVDIQGPGASVITVDGAGKYSLIVFNQIDASAGSDAISGLTLTGGLAEDNNDRSGGGIQKYEGDADLTVSDMVVTGNTSSSNDAGGIQLYETAGNVLVERTNVSNNSASDGGGAFYNWESGGTLTVTIADSTLSGNSSDYGGAIYQHGGSLDIRNTTISTNTARDGDGGGINTSDTTLTLESSTVSGNTATDDSGGGVQADGGSFTMSGSVVSGNTASYYGGGLHLYNTNPVITTSTISGNTASGGGGGGIFLYDDGSSSTLTMRNSTVSGNTAQYYGGGFYVQISGASTIQNSTISGNHASQAGGVYGSGGGVALTQVTISNNEAKNPSSGTAVGGVQLTGVGEVPTAASQHAHPHRSSSAEIHSVSDHEAAKSAGHVRSSQVHTSAATAEYQAVGTIIAGNAGEDVGVYNTSATLNSDHSILGVVDAGVTVSDVGGTQKGVTDPGLAPLGDNGGPTLTQALVAGSPAIDAGPQPEPTFPGSDFDQRGTGFARVVNGTVDVGAYEVQPPPPVEIAPKFTG
jgi:parallel beta-helix repeat protein